MTDKQKIISAIIVTILVCANTVAGYLGFDWGLTEAGISAGVGLIVTLVGIIWNTWHNCNITNAAQVAQMFLDTIKQMGDAIDTSGITLKDVQEFLDNFKKEE